MAKIFLILKVATHKYQSKQNIEKFQNKFNENPAYFEQKKV